MKNWARYDKKMSSGLHVNYPFLLSILMKLEFSRVFLKMLKYQISWKSFRWEPSYSMRRHDEANSRFSQFCERYSQTENYTLAQIQDTYLYLSQLNT